MGTKDRILAAAADLFAEKNYRGATVSQICRAAGANIAAVNYHFRNKENLYRMAWRSAHDRVRGRFPPDGGVPAGAPAAERLRGRIKAALQRSLSDDSTEFRIMDNEVANPTGLLRHVVEDAIRPLKDAMRSIIREMIGPSAGKRDVELCGLYVIGPIMQMGKRQRVRDSHGLPPAFSAGEIEEIADHFTAFVMAGIKQIRRIGKGTAGKT